MANSRARPARAHPAGRGTRPRRVEDETGSNRGRCQHQRRQSPEHDVSGPPAWSVPAAGSSPFRRVEAARATEKIAHGRVRCSSWRSRRGGSVDGHRERRARGASRLRRRSSGREWADGACARPRGNSLPLRYGRVLLIRPPHRARPRPTPPSAPSSGARAEQIRHPQPQGAGDGRIGVRHGLVACAVARQGRLRASGGHRGRLLRFASSIHRRRARAHARLSAGARSARIRTRDGSPSLRARAGSMGLHHSQLAVFVAAAEQGGVIRAAARRAVRSRRKLGDGGDHALELDPAYRCSSAGPETSRSPQRQPVPAPRQSRSSATFQRPPTPSARRARRKAPVPGSNLPRGQATCSDSSRASGAAYPRVTVTGHREAASTKSSTS